MADTLTTNYSLTKPEIGGSNDSWGTKINANLDVLDTTIKAVSNVANAALPSSSYTAADVLAKLLTVDGTGTGLDADLLDGQHGAYYADVAARLGYTPVNKAGDTMSGPLHINSTNGVRVNNTADDVGLAYASFNATGGNLGYIGFGGASNNMQIWNSRNATLQFGTNNLERMRIDQSGQVGIGTQTPTQKLDVYSSGSGTDVRSVVRNDVGVGVLGVLSDNNVYIGAISATDLKILTGGAERMAIAAAGGVGIGTAPVTGYALATSTQGISIGNGGSLSWGTYAGGGPTIAGSTNFIALYPNGVTSGEQARLTNIGRLGVRQPAPQTVLHVKSPAGELGRFESEAARGAGNAYVSISDPTGIKGYFGYGSSDDTMTVVQSMNAAMVFYTNGIERFNIAAGGAISAANSTFTIGGAQVATQAYVTGLGYAPLASPALTGTPTHGGIEIGYRDIPRVTGGIERGKCNAVAAGFTVNTGPAAGSAYSVYNDSAAAFTITQGAGLTLRLGGTTTTGDRTLAPRGFATIWFNSTTEAIIQGSGVS